MSKALNLIIEQQIRRVLNKYLKTIEVTKLSPTPDQVTTQNIGLELGQDDNSKFFLPAIVSLLKNRLISGGTPIKLSTNKIYISSGVALFDEDNLLIFDATEIEIPSYCLHPNTTVYIKDKENKIRIMTLKQLKEEGITDKYILSPTGWKKINKIWSSTHKSYVEFNFGTNGKIVCSLNHKFPVSHDDRTLRCEIKKAKDLREDKKHRLLDRLLFVSIEKFLDNNNNKFINKFLYRNKERIYEETLNYDLGKFIGLIVAEGGFLDTSEGKITLHKKEDNLKNEFIKILKKFNIYYNNKYYNNYQVIVFYSKRIYNLYNSFCKNKCTNKKLNMDLILNCPYDFRKGLFDGIIAGDGWTSHNSIEFTSSSKNLRDDVYLLAISIGLIASKHKEHKQYDKRAKKTYKSYALRILLPKKINKKHPHTKELFECRTIRFTDLKIINKEIELIDISVEDKLFLIEGGLISHNSEDRWVWVYLNKDGTFTTNKYAPNIGDNTKRIPICKVWKEKNSTDFDYNLVRDIRPVGAASANLNHVIRQLVLNLFYGIPITFLEYINVNPKSGMTIHVGSDNDTILYARLNGIKDADVTIPTPTGSGEVKNYFVLLKAIVDNNDGDDLTYEYIVKPTDEDLKIYEIPVALIRNVTSSTTEITSNMIETYGIQKKSYDNFNKELVFKQKGTLSESTSGSPSYVDSPMPIIYNGKLVKMVTWIGNISLNSGEYLELKLYKNNELITTITVSESGSDKVIQTVLNEKVLPKDIIKIEITNVPSSSGSYVKDIVIRVINGVKIV